MNAEHRLVGCVLPRGLGVELLSRLFREKGINRAETRPARGVLGSDPSGLLNRIEKDFLTVVVEAERADEIFAWIYHQAGVAREEGRFLYMTRLSAATPFTLPPDLQAT